ncbi:MAG: polyphosphate polymerase domain-containing protein [Bacteroidota bacterium]
MAEVSWRYERKYRIEGNSLPQILAWLQGHPAAFRPLYPRRQVNNIYFDDPQLTAYHENVFGVGERQKVRLRWYGPTDPPSGPAQLEVKIKRQELGTKHIIPREAPFALSQIGAIEHWVQAQLPAGRPYLATLLNAYERDYFISADRRFRLTLDVNLRYHYLRSSPEWRTFVRRDPAIILEVKYEQAWDQLADEICRYIPFRQSKHSKYVQGLQMGQKI